MLFLWADCPEKLTYAWVRRFYKICFLTLRLVNDSFSFFDFFYLFLDFLSILDYLNQYTSHIQSMIFHYQLVFSLSLFFFLKHCQFRRIKYFLSYYLCFFFLLYFFFMCKDSSHKLAGFIEHYCILCLDRHQVIVLFSMAVFVNNNSYTPSFLSHSYVSKIKVSLVALITWRQTLDTN